MTDKMLSRRDGAIGHMIFNQPEKHNAVSLEMWEAAERILQDFETDPAIRVLVLSGAGGKSFVAGADISEFDEQRGTADAQAHYNARTRAVYRLVENFPKPVIAMIHGFCIGGGRRPLKTARDQSQRDNPHDFLGIVRAVYECHPTCGEDLQHAETAIHG